MRRFRVSRSCSCGVVVVVVVVVVVAVLLSPSERDRGRDGRGNLKAPGVMGAAQMGGGVQVVRACALFLCAAARVSARAAGARGSVGVRACWALALLDCVENVRLGATAGAAAGVGLGIERVWVGVRAVEQEPRSCWGLGAEEETIEAEVPERSVAVGVRVGSRSARGTRRTRRSEERTTAGGSSERSGEA